MDKHIDKHLQIAAEQADQCVKCGLCLQFCPTFQLTGQENESPRGRISLVQGLAKQQITVTPKLSDHLDHCLQCRTCERVCPSEVAYGNIIKMARQSITPKQSPKLLRFLIQKNNRIWCANKLIFIAQLMRLTNLLAYLGNTKLLKQTKLPMLSGVGQLIQLNNLLPRKLIGIKSLNKSYPALSRQIGTVNFFPGCVNKLVDLENCHAAIKLLCIYGYKVIIAKHHCCGALDELSGKHKLAKQHANQATHNRDNHPILTMATGCLAHIKLSYSQSSADQFHDFLSFLATLELPKDYQFKPLDKQKTAVIHQPCTQQNALKLNNPALKLLTQIPGLTLTTPNCQTSCCGSAGDYSLKFAENSQRLAKQLITELEESQPDWLITTNIGCGLQLAKYANTTVIHPVKLLAQQITKI